MQYASQVFHADQVDAARQAADRRWAPLATRASKKATVAEVEAAYSAIHQVAEDLSGTSIDARKRAILYYALYEDSGRNFMFPLVATHGSLWGVTHTQRLEWGLGWLRPLSRRGQVDRWLEAVDMVRDLNRRVFVEIYSTFYFTRYYGTHSRATKLIEPNVLPLYNRVHRAIADDAPLTLEERREVYYGVFVHEQHAIVDPGIHEAADHAGSRTLLKTLKHVRPRFKYFPPGEHLTFTDFTSVDQRNREGLRALAFAEQVGPQRVFDAMNEY